MKRFLAVTLFSSFAFAKMSASISGWLPTYIAAPGGPVAPINQPVQAQIMVGNDSGSSVTIISVKPFAVQTGDTNGGSLKAKAINFGQVCLSGVGGPTGSCNNIAPGTSFTNGASLVLNVPMVFFGSSSFPPWVQFAPAIAEFGNAGTNGSSLVFGFGGSSVLAATGTYIVDAVLQGSDGSYFTTSGGSTINIQALKYAEGK